jgi:hypothetical protein
MERLMKDSKMKDIEALEKVPQAEKDARHTERLYPPELDKAIVSENPLTYSRAKLISLIGEAITDDLDVISDYIDEEIAPLFKLI